MRSGDGHGEKFSRRQEAAIAALLSETTVAAAAKTARVGEATLARWLKDPQFGERYRQARKQVLEIAVARLAKIAQDAVATLHEVASNSQSPASSRVTAARAIIETALKTVEIEDIQQRLSELEKSVKSKKEV